MKKIMDFMVFLLLSVAGTALLSVVASLGWPPILVGLAVVGVFVLFLALPAVVLEHRRRIRRRQAPVVVMVPPRGTLPFEEARRQLTQLLEAEDGTRRTKVTYVLVALRANNRIVLRRDMPTIVRELVLPEGNERPAPSADEVEIRRRRHDVVRDTWQRESSTAHG